MIAPINAETPCLESSIADDVGATAVKLSTSAQHRQAHAWMSFGRSIKYSSYVKIPGLMNSIVYIDQV